MRSELGQFIPRIVAIGILSVSCSARQAGPSQESKPQAQPQTQECFIPANQRAMLPEQLARDIEKKCELPAIPRSSGGRR